MTETLRVLIIDDDEDTRFTFSRFLNKFDGMPVSIREAETGREGLDLYGREHFDCVLLDYSLPGMTGVDVLRELVARDPHAPVVMLTGQGNEDVAVEVMKLGASDYLSKDKVNAQSMQRVVMNTIDHATLSRKVAEQQQDLQNFARVLVHDLKNPLNGIMGYSEMLAMDARTDARTAHIQDDLELIHKCAKHMNELIDALQQYTRGSEVVPHDPVWIDAATEQAVTNLGTMIKERKATIQNQMPNIEIDGNRAQLVQLIQNLTGNALKYCLDRPPLVRIEGFTDSGLFHITISDNGIGIPADKLTEIFSPFVRLHKGEQMFAGTGLGLATCKRIVERHNGRIWCTSVVGKGSTFHITLPLT